MIALLSTVDKGYTPDCTDKVAAALLSHCQCRRIITRPPRNTQEAGRSIIPSLTHLNTISRAPKNSDRPPIPHMIQFTVVTRNMLQIHWIFAGRRDTLTPPPSDFRQNPRNQAGSAMDTILIFKRFG